VWEAFVTFAINPKKKQSMLLLLVLAGHSLRRAPLQSLIVHRESHWQSGRAMGAVKSSAAAFRFVYAFGRRGEFHQQVCTSSWSRVEASTAIGTATTETVFHAICTEGALEGANQRLQTVWGKVFVTTFTAWTNFQHVQILA